MLRHSAPARSYRMGFVFKRPISALVVVRRFSIREADFMFTDEEDCLKEAIAKCWIDYPTELYNCVSTLYRSVECRPL